MRLHRSFFTAARSIFLQRAGWTPLLAGSLFLMAAVGALAADEPSAQRDLAVAPDAGDAATIAPASEARVFRVQGAVITWNVLREGGQAMSEAQRAQLGEAIRAALAATAKEREATAKKVEIERLDNGLQGVRFPLSVLLPPIPPEKGHNQEDR